MRRLAAVSAALLVLSWLASAPATAAAKLAVIEVKGMVCNA
jgi:hypothetical protein